VDDRHRLQGIISTGDLINADVLPLRRRLLRTALELGDVTAQAVVTSPLMSPQASSATQPLTHTGALHEAAAQQQPIAEYINPEVTTVSEHAPLPEVIDALILAPLKRVIVVDDQRHVLGIISDVDMLARIREEARPGILKALTGWARGRSAHVPTGVLQTGSQARDAADMMNRDAVTVRETATVQETIERMIATGRKILPVLDEQGRLLGAVGRSDPLRVLLEG
jgi:CBS domain-containing protein